MSVTRSHCDIVIDWLKERGSDDWHRLTLGWNWDIGMSPLKWIVEQPECDKATALQVFWHSGADNVAARSNIDDAKQHYCEEAWPVLKGIAERWTNGGFTRSELAFSSPEQMDEETLREMVKFAGASDFAFAIPAEMFAPRAGRQLTTPKA